MSNTAKYITWGFALMMTALVFVIVALVFRPGGDTVTLVTVVVSTLFAPMLLGILNLIKSQEISSKADAAVVKAEETHTLVNSTVDEFKKMMAEKEAESLRKIAALSAALAELRTERKGVSPEVSAAQIAAALVKPAKE